MSAPVAGIRWRDLWKIDPTPLTSAGRPPQHRGHALVKPAEDNRPIVTPRHRAERERMSLRGAR